MSTVPPEGPAGEADSSDDVIDDVGETSDSTAPSADSAADNPSAGSDDAAADTSKTPAATTRRPNPAASAASRARRIGGATATRQVPTAAAESTAAGEPTVSMRKRQPRTTSARELKAEAAGSPSAVTEVPAWLRWVPAAVLTVCAVAMIVIIAVSAHGVWYAKASTSSARDKVLAAAKKCTASTNTYNYKTLAADEKRGLACTTGAWTTQYRSALEKIVKPTATQLKASQTVDITSAGIESVTNSGRQWTTIVYGQLTINQAGATPRIDQFAAIVRLDKVKSSYRVSKIDLVTSPNA